MGISLLLVGAFFPVWLAPRVARRAMFGAVGVRLGMAIANSNSESGFIGSQLDALVFWERIEELAIAPMPIDWSTSDFGGGAQLFIKGSAEILRALGIPSSYLAAHLISVIAAGMCMALLARCWMKISPNDISGIRVLIIVYALMPSLATNQSYVLREAWQSLALIMVFFGSLSWFLDRAKLRWITVIVSGVVLGSALHNSLAVPMLASFAIALVFAMEVNPGSVLRRPSKVFAVPVSALLLAVVSALLLTGNIRFQSLVEGSFATDATEFLSGAERAAERSRAFYGNTWDPARPWTAIRSFLAYMVYPLPTQIRVIADVVAFGENMLRIACLLTWWRYRRHLPGHARTAIAVAVAMFIVVEGAWSLGTLNWGTANRHHAMGLSLVLLAGFSSWRAFKAASIDGSSGSLDGSSTHRPYTPL